MVEDTPPQEHWRSSPTEIERLNRERCRYEASLVASVLAGEAGAGAEFVRVATPPLQLAIGKIESAEDDRRAALVYVFGKLREDGYSRLRAFNGRPRLSVFIALTARELLAQRAAVGILQNSKIGWIRFKRVFDGDIFARIKMRFPYDDNARWDDLYQDIFEKLVEDDCRRLRTYRGGNFVGFVHIVIDRLLIDLVRREAPRRRLPVAIKALPRLEQEIYIAVAWKDCAADVGRLTEFLRGRLDQDPDETEVRDALARVLEIVVLPPREPSAKPTAIPLDAILPAAVQVILATSSPTPEEALLLAEEEDHREAIIALVRTRAEELLPIEQLYLQVAFSATEALPRRRIAVIMGCSVDEVDRLKQRTQRWLASVREGFEESRACPSFVK
jgi:RNA polymerase primary sigma factor